VERVLTTIQFVEEDWDQACPPPSPMGNRDWIHHFTLNSRRTFEKRRGRRKDRRKGHEGLAWIDLTLEWFDQTVTPVSLFAMGVWMGLPSSVHKLLSLPLERLLICMFSKLVIVPVVMIIVARGLGLDNRAGRAAVLISSLPIS
jgi:hypothetical protein